MNYFYGHTEAVTLSSGEAERLFRFLGGLYGERSAGN
jgi:hypothetical protein